MDSRPLNGDNLLFSTSEQAVQRVASRVFSQRERKTVIVMDRGARGRQERGETEMCRMKSVGNERLGEAVG